MPNRCWEAPERLPATQKLPTLHDHLEKELHGELYFAGVVVIVQGRYRSHQTSGCRLHSETVRVVLIDRGLRRRREVWRIEQIEDLGPELETYRLRQRKFLEDGEVD